jgi:hypothetical protein
LLIVRDTETSSASLKRMSAVSNTLQCYSKKYLLLNIFHQQFGGLAKGDEDI